MQEEHFARAETIFSLLFYYIYFFIFVRRSTLIESSKARSQVLDRLKEAPTAVLLYVSSYIFF